MRITDTAANAALDAALPGGANQGQLSLHSAFSAAGANLVGAKTACTFSAAGSRVKTLAAAVDVTVPGAATVRWVGAWSADGSVFKGMMPNGGAAKLFQVDLANNRVLCEGHGYVNDDKVVFANDTVPAPLSEGTEYFVVGVTAADPDYFQVSNSQGGAAIDLAGLPGAACFVSKLIAEVYSGAGTHRVNTFSLLA